MHQLQQAQYLGATKHRLKTDSGINIVEVDYTYKVFEGWHSHENLHLTLFLKGGTVEKRRKETKECLPGMVTLYRSYEQHKNYNTKLPSKNINLDISSNLMQNLCISESGMQELVADQASAKTLMLRLYRESLEADAFTSDSLKILLTNFSNKALFFQQPGGVPSWVKKLYELLNDRWNENIGLNELAMELNLHPVTISRFFPAYFGNNYGAYMRKLKIDRAIDLIIQKKYTLTQIAYQCGFADQSHFIRTFKKLTGFLPKHFERI